MHVTKFKDGIVICGSFPSEAVVVRIAKELAEKHDHRLPLVVADPPYGNVTKNDWDKVKLTDAAYAMKLVEGMQELEGLQSHGDVAYWWGGIGKPGFRPFFKFISSTETHTAYQMVDLVTWKKKRGYGVQNKYLFVREELAYFCLGGTKPNVFNIPLLDKERGYAGYNEKYPAKSKYLRRTNVWDDITEILRGKTHDAEKPVALSGILITAHTKPGDVVLDLYSASGSCSIAARSLGRQFIAVERDPAEYAKIVAKLRRN